MLYDSRCSARHRLLPQHRSTPPRSRRRGIPRETQRSDAAPLSERYGGPAALHTCASRSSALSLVTR